MTSERAQKILLVRVLLIRDRASRDPIKCICLPPTLTFTITLLYTVLHYWYYWALYYVGVAKSHYSICVSRENSSDKSVFFNKISWTYPALAAPLYVNPCHAMRIGNYCASLCVLIFSRFSIWMLAMEHIYQPIHLWKIGPKAVNFFLTRLMRQNQQSFWLK